MNPARTVKRLLPPAVVYGCIDEQNIKKERIWLGMGPSLLVATLNIFVLLWKTSRWLRLPLMTRLLISGAMQLKQIPELVKNGKRQNDSQGEEPLQITHENWGDETQQADQKWLCAMPTKAGHRQRKIRNRHAELPASMTRRQFLIISALTGLSMALKAPAVAREGVIKPEAAPSEFDEVEKTVIPGTEIVIYKHSGSHNYVLGDWIEEALMGSSADGE